MRQRPLPVVDELSRPYWEGARHHRLVVQRCSHCGTYVHPPKEACPACRHDDLAPTELSGRGRVYSWSVMHSPGNPGFDERLPYTVLVVDLDEQPGLRTVGNLVGASPQELTIGAPLEVCFEEVTDEVTLPQWQLAGAGAR